MLTSLFSSHLDFFFGHYYLSDNQISVIKSSLVPNPDSERITNYERKFSKLIGDGYGLTFASARMAFYSLMKVLNIGSGHEIILLGFTCSVMANAVLRVGAKPVFSDVDIDTFGSSPEEIEKRITSKTKLIVAQHSFGIPCKINEIVEIAGKRNIFLLEDCAITFDSLINGKRVGTFGDAAVFSTDHTKPLNTLIGGFLYTPNIDLFQKIHKYRETLPNLDKGHHRRLFRQFLFERKTVGPGFFPHYKVLKLFGRIWNVIQKRAQVLTFLEDDYSYSDRPTSNVYPYPAKFPEFLAELGLFEIARWEQERKRRKKNLAEYIKIAHSNSLTSFLPKAYFDPNLEIVPLRFCFLHPEASKIKKACSSFLDVSGIWFQKPLICSPNGLETLGYNMGNCPISEEIGRKIINLPCVIRPSLRPNFFGNFQAALSYLGESNL